MLKLSIGDKLLVMQTSTVISIPWGYQLTYLPTSSVVASDNGITEDYKIIDLFTGFDDYEDKTLLLEILDNNDDILEDDLLLISGPYSKYEQARLLVGLLGENVKHLSGQENDFQDGHELHKTITLYESSSQDTELGSYEWNQSYVADFTPDARYQTNEIKQREEP